MFYEHEDLDYLQINWVNCFFGCDFIANPELLQLALATDADQSMIQAMDASRRLQASLIYQKPYFAIERICHRDSKNAGMVLQRKHLDLFLDESKQTGTLNELTGAYMMFY